MNLHNVINLPSTNQMKVPEPEPAYSNNLNINNSSTIEIYQKKINQHSHVQVVESKLIVNKDSMTET